MVRFKVRAFRIEIILRLISYLGKPNVMKKLFNLAVLLLFAHQVAGQTSAPLTYHLSADPPALRQVQQQFDLPINTASVQSELAALVQITQQLQRFSDPKKAAAEAVALRTGMPLRTTLPDGRVAEIARLSPTGMVMYYITSNLGAAVTTGVDKVWPGGSAGLSLAGSGMFLGEWDGGAVRLTHQEFPSNAVTQVDGATTLSDHATHVAGTMVARGINASAKGMAYQATLAAYDWNSDETEMMAAAGNGMLASNHSYGLVTGFEWGNWSGITGWHWMSEPGDTEDRNFGRYSDQARDWDLIANNRPNYLIVKAAGNDRGNGPTPGASYFHQIWNGTAWVWQATTMIRQLDGGAAGFDCLGHAAGAKNVLTVGAVSGIVGGYTNPAQVVMSSFSSWGPTDDGRIKPDIVGKGVSLTSAFSGANNAYATISGTSMASPNVTGGLILLQQHYKNLNSNQVMTASALKALVLHTADEAGANPGPDYVHGWGLMNVKKATDVIGNIAGKHAIIATTLAHAQTYTFQVNSNGTEPLRATIVWNDPAGAVPAYVLNGTTPALVRDLDVRIIRNSDNVIFSPWTLNPANRTAAATTGDNVRDNVEQVLLANPVAGTYTVRVTHKGTLSSPQAFSLILSGLLPTLTSQLTFQVDMTGKQVSGSGVHIAGSFQGWSASATRMTRVGVSQIYTYAASFSQGDTLEYKFINGSSWSGFDSINNVAVDSSEQLPLSCRRPGSTNRFVVVPTQALVLPIYGFGSCSVTTTLLNETFSAGIPGSWTNSGTANGLANVNARFAYRGPATTPNNTVGSRGAFNNGRGPLRSPTLANGFVILDSDWLDNNGSTSGGGTGVAPGQHIVSLSSPSFSTVGITALTLKFNQSYRRFAGPGGLQIQPATFLVFSKNNGASWPDTVMINANVFVNGLPDSTSQLRLAVGSYLGNTAAARIQFLFNGFYYNWMLDDISVSGTAAHDLAMLKPTTTRNNTPEFYGMLPLNQLDSMRFGAQAYNVGADAQSGVGLRAEIFRNGQNVWTEFNGNNQGLLQPGDTTNVAVNQPPYYPSQLGSYRVAMEVTNFQTDSYTTNNRDTLNFLVTDTTMALDNGGFAAGVIGTNTFAAGNEDGMLLANAYVLRRSAEVTSANVRFQSNSAPGATVRFHIFASANLNITTPIMSSAIRTLTAGDIANGLTLSFLGTTGQRTLPSGAFYLAVELNSNGGANHIRVLDQLNVPMDAQAAIIYLPQFTQWYDNGNAFLLRLNSRAATLNCTTAISAPGLSANNQVTVCSGSSIVLSSPVDPTATFQWYRNGTPVGWSTNHELQVFVDGNYYQIKTVGSCSATSGTIQVNVTNTPVATIGLNGPSFYPAGSAINTQLVAGAQVVLRLGTQQIGGGVEAPYFRADSLNGWTAQVRTSIFAADMVVARDGTAGDSLACNALINAAQLNGKVAIIYRGACEFGIKALAAQQAGAVAVLIVNNIENALPPSLGPGSVGAQLTIPVLSVSLETGRLLRQFIQTGQAGAALGQSTNSAITYQWYRNNNPIGGATQATYQATQAGKYSLIMNPGFTCTSESQPVYLRQSIFQQTPWQIQNLNQPAVNLTVASVHAVDSQVIWSISDTPDGLAFPVTFFRSTNGGTTWIANGIPGTVGLGTSSITAVDANKAWVTLFGDSARQGVYHTSNGGVSWTRQATAYNNGGFPNVTRFFNANVGVTMGDMAGGFLEIYTTSNGGQLWNRVPSTNLPNFIDPFTAGMVDEATVSGSTIYYPLNNGNYVYSSNFGQQWTQKVTQVTGQMQLTAADTNTLVIFGTEGMRYSLNGGNSWSSMPNEPGVGLINATKFIPGTTVYTLMVSGTLGTAYTTDFVNWNFIDSVYHKELSFVGPRHGWSGGVSTTANQQGMYRWNSTHFMNAAPPSAQARIYGTVRYNNTSLTPLSNALVTIRRTPTMDFVDSVRTNTLGQYVSAQINSGTYAVTATTAKSWGGGNATDALLISRHFASLAPLQGQRLTVADVNASTQVNNTDALLVGQRFIGAIPTFLSGDWHTTSVNFSLSSGDSTMQNLSALCYGDVNGSYTPQGNARESSQVLLVQDEPMQLSTSQYTEVLVQAQNTYTIGAMSLVLQLPQGLRFEDVRLVPAHNQALSYQLTGQELRISWFSLQAISVYAGDNLLKLRFLNGTLPAGQHGIQIGSASEIADAAGLLIPGATLVIPQLVGVYESNRNSLLQLAAYPNPFQRSTQLHMDLPEAGQLELEIRDLSGRLVKTIDLGPQAAGRQEVLLERDMLRSGMYFVTVKLQSAENRYLRILRLIAE